MSLMAIEPMSILWRDTRSSNKSKGPSKFFVFTLTDNFLSYASPGIINVARFPAVAFKYAENGLKPKT